MELLDYESFGRLRVRDFWPEAERVSHLSLIECWLGSGDGEVYGWSYFLWPAGHAGEVSEIGLEAMFAPDCTPVVSEKILRRIGLSLRPGDSVNTLIEKLGEPSFRDHVRDNTHLEFIVGERETYFVRCTVGDATGFDAISIVREDRRQKD